MDNSLIQKKIEKVFLKIIKTKITLNSNNKNVKKWDSLNHIKIVLSIEKEFNIKFALSEFDEINNIKNLKKLIKSKIN